MFPKNVNLFTQGHNSVKHFTKDHHSVFNVWEIIVWQIYPFTPSNLLFYSTGGFPLGTHRPYKRKCAVIGRHHTEVHWGLDDDNRTPLGGRRGPVLYHKKHTWFSEKDQKTNSLNKQTILDLIDN